MSMFKWDVVDPAPGRAGRSRPAAGLGQDGRHRGPARRRDVRRHVRVPARHGAGRQPRDHVLGHLHDPVPADHPEQGAQLPRAPAPRSWAASSRSRAQGGDSADVTGAIMVAGLVLLAVGVLVHFAGAGLIHKILPPAVTGAVVMLIGFNLAPVVANIYWPQDQWVALLTAAFMVVRGRAACQASGRGSRCCLALIFGYPALVAVRRDLRHDQLGRPGARHGGHRARPAVGLGRRSRRPTGSVCRAARSPTGWTSSTARASR